MKNNGGRRAFAWILSALLVVSLLPAMAFAGETTLEVTKSNCALMGFYDEDPVFIFTGTVPEDAETVRFSDFEPEEVTYLTPLESYDILEETNEAPMTGAYRLSADSFSSKEDWEPESAYEAYTTENCYGYCVIDEESMTYFVIPFEQSEEPLPELTFTAKANDKEITNIATVKGGYSYYGDVKDLLVLTIPMGTEEVAFSFSRNCLAYNYTGEGNSPVVAKDYLTGAIADFTKGILDYTAKVDSDSVDYYTGETIEADGQMDYVQVQNVYKYDPPNYSGGDLLYAFTFRYDLFNAFIDDQALSKINSDEAGYQPGEEWVQDEDGNWIPKSVDPVPLYTVTVPEGTEQVELVFPENRLAYNYTADGTYIDVNGLEYNKGTTDITVEIDKNGDGEPDCIQVQIPGTQTVLYAITFDGMTLEKPEDPEKEKATAEDLLQNIAQFYSENGAIGDDRALWIAADMMAFEKVFPNTDFKWTEEQKQALVDEAIATIDRETASAGNISKAIIALAGMGYDASKITTSTGQELDGVQKLLDLSLTDQTVSSDVQGVYTLPWVMIALQEFEDKYSEELDLLTEELVSEALPGGGWGYSYGGTDYFDVDGTAYALMALSQDYPNNDSVKKSVEGAEEAIHQQVVLNEEGAVSSWGSPSAESTAMLIAGLRAIGEELDTFFPEKSLLEGLVSLQDSTATGFTFSGERNAISTEEGFCGLIAAAKASDSDNYLVYDFSGQSLKPAVASKGNVTFQVVPENAEVTVTTAEGETVEPADGAYLYDLAEGTYDYTVTCDGYRDKSGSVTVSSEDVKNRIKQTVSVSLTRNSSASGSDTVDVTVKVLVHGTDCDNTVTYKNDPEKYHSLLKGDSYTATLKKNEGTARDALVEALDDSGLTYEEISNGYFPTIDEYTEFTHGANSGWLYLIDGKAGTTAVKNVTFRKDSELTFFFTDDYTKDYGSEKWGGSSSGSGGKTEPSVEPTQKGYYDDTQGHWAEASIDEVTEKGWMNGVADRTFAPDTTLSRAMFVTILMRLDAKEGNEKTENPSSDTFTDVQAGSWYEDAVTWAVQNGIVKGTSDTTFSPNAPVTREQMATFLHRYTAYKGYPMSASLIAADRFDDLDDISEYAINSMPWAIGAGLINGMSDRTLSPKGTATRAQAATLLLRYEEKVVR